MKSNRSFICFFLFISSIEIIHTNDQIYPWLNLPSTPSLPHPNQGHFLQLTNHRLWYNICGQSIHSPVLFLHGGLANSDYWSLQIQELQIDFQCIVMDSRGHGRSSSLSSSSESISYELMTSDVIALLDYLHLDKVHVIGWSDGANVGLHLGMNYSHRLFSLFIFGANYKAGEDNQSIPPLFLTYLQRVEVEYKKSHSNEEYEILFDKLLTMWHQSPNWTKVDLEKIPSDLLIWIVSGDRDEVIPREQTETIFKWLPQSGQLTLPRTSHFAFLQDSQMFNLVLRKFLNQNRNSSTNGSTILTRSLNLLSFIFLFRLIF
ncbi:unnamed protein product [Adineta ricciae]|uniref:AB hydrolase-1 domain-containing protein n=1 Tax=Adineta ricciae TaxID=249248 RepID=A0A814FUD0_ADIRI|nr:unnamed protein product [Adineta ricciae]